MNDIVMRFRTEHGQTVDMTLNDLEEAYYEYRFLTKREYILENYPNAYAIAKDLGEYIYENFGIIFQESEIGYLALHIQLIQNS